MLQNAYFLAKISFKKIGADTAENEQHFAEILGNRLRRSRPDRHSGSRVGFAVPSGIQHDGRWIVRDEEGALGCQLSGAYEKGWVVGIE